jgi:hypothetical protein
MRSEASVSRNAAVGAIEQTDPEACLKRAHGLAECAGGAAAGGNHRMHEAIRGRDPGDTRQVEHRN